MNANLILTGMPGSGKTTVGRLLAEELERAFVDTDEVVARLAGHAPAEILRRDGEAAFRAWEREAVATLAGRQGAVIATGGWTLGDPPSRATLERIGTVVCLDASVETLASRLLAEGLEDRPLVHDGAAGSATTDDLARLAARLGQLLERRRHVYDALPWHVATAGRSPGKVADETASLVDVIERMDVVAVPVRTPEGGYGVRIGPGLLDVVGVVVRAAAPAPRALVVTDEDVGAIYGSRVTRALATAGMRASRATIPVGEPAKTLDTIRELYQSLVLCDLDRRGLVVALGGGIVGDVAGFAEATYLRGVRVVQLPTSLLAMVDASVGGKTGVNLPAGKNLVGAFHHPALVLVDPNALGTLPEEHLRWGASEIVKAALIGDTDLLGALEAGGLPRATDAPAWSDTIRRCVAVKAAIVSRDPHETGERAHLNLGHTFAHALELASGYTLTHGEAVAVGLVGATRLAARTGHAPTDLARRVEALLDSLGLPTRSPGLVPEAVHRAMEPDKKRAGDRLRFVLPRSDGGVAVADDIAPRDVSAVLAELCAAGETPVRPVDAGHGSS